MSARRAPRHALRRPGQVELDPRKVGLVKPVDIGIAGDAKLAAQELLAQLSSGAKTPRAEIAAAKVRGEP